MPRAPRFVCCLAIALIAPHAHAATIAVTSNADTGANTLRAAITAANLTPAADVLSFNLAAGKRTIALTTPLPSVTAPLDIDGTSQPGYTSIPLVRIDGIGLPAGESGLRLAANNCTVRGLMIVRAPDSGIVIDSGVGLKIHSMYLGTDGVSALGNDVGLTVNQSALSLFGATVAGRENVISGNTSTGILLGSAANFNQVSNNRIGTNAAGTVAIPNGYAGIRVLGDSNAIGEGTAVSMNLLSGNTRFGITIDATADGTLLYGNRIGTTFDGNAPLGNLETGIDDSGTATRIGGTEAGMGNLVSGNNPGVLLSGSGTTLVANRIGTNAAGTAAIANTYAGIRVFGDNIEIGAAGLGNLISGNARFGIELSDSSHDVVIDYNRIGTDTGGTIALGNVEDGIHSTGDDIVIGGAGNVISGNGGNGISVAAGSDGLSILANRIGTNAAGSAALGNGGYGVRVLDGNTLVLGQAGAGNLVSGNHRGIVLELGGPATIQGNVIGLDSTQTAAMGNEEFGLEIHTAGNQIGGSAAGAGNVIAANTFNGLVLGRDADGNVVEGNRLGTDANSSTVFGNGYANLYVYQANDNRIGGGGGKRNVFRGGPFGAFIELGAGNTLANNSFDAHVLSAIEIGAIGPEANDANDADHGANDGMNRPVLRSAIVQSGNVEIAGTLPGAPNAGYAVEFFHSNTCHGSGLGEGKHPLGAIEVQAGANGYAPIDATVPNPDGAGFITATATDGAGNTSEFSPCIATGAPGPGEFSLWRPTLLAYEDIPALNVFVLRSHGLEGSASVRLHSIDDTATAPADYTAVDTVLTFAPGEWIKTVPVAIAQDALNEPTEEFTAELLTPTGGAALGTRSSANVLLFNHSGTYPFASIGDAAVSEPASGAGIAQFVITLTPSDHPVTLTWNTYDGTATAGSDYVAASGAVTFAIGETTKLVNVSVLADGVGEGDESFYVHVGGTSGEFIANDLDGQAIIGANDGGADALFADGFE